MSERDAGLRLGFADYKVKRVALDALKTRIERVREKCNIF
jgi:hypothetical protein